VPLHNERQSLEALAGDFCVKIAVDLMGGSGAGNENLRACSRYPDPDELILVGLIDQLAPSLVSQLRSLGADFRSCSSVLCGDETPRTLLKKSGQTSLAVALALLARGEVDAVVSSADTKAIMVLGRSQVGTIHSLKRPAIAKAFLGPMGQFYMLDLGANVRCSPDLLQQFARLGSALHHSHTESEHHAAARVGLLNIGTERGKGTAELNQAANLFRGDPDIHFVGFIEPSDLFAGSADVIVCDGYAGNLVLKTVESMASFLRSQLRELEMSTDPLHSLAAKVDIDRYNGALLAGLEGVVIKSHGSASERGFLHAILQGRESVQGQLLRACTEALATT